MASSIVKSRYTGKDFAERNADNVAEVTGGYFLMHTVQQILERILEPTFSYKFLWSN